MGGKIEWKCLEIKEKRGPKNEPFIDNRRALCTPGLFFSLASTITAMKALASESDTMKDEQTQEED